MVLTKYKPNCDEPSLDLKANAIFLINTLTNYVLHIIC